MVILFANFIPNFTVLLIVATLIIDVIIGFAVIVVIEVIAIIIDIVVINLENLIDIINLLVIFINFL